MAKLTGDISAPWRVPLLLLAFASLFIGMGAGLARLGWSLPAAGLPPSLIAKRVFLALVAVLLGGVTASLFARPVGTTALGIALTGLALWLMRQDVARQTVKTSGLTRFIAICLLSGYVWLALSGTSILLSGGLGLGGAAYDAALHAVLLGFVFSMVFGHAPIIFPAVLRVAVPYSPYFYVPLALLHGSLFIRLAGDWMGFPEWRAWGGALNGLALLAFVLGTVGAVIRGAFTHVPKALRRARTPFGIAIPI